MDVFKVDSNLGDTTEDSTGGEDVVKPTYGVYVSCEEYDEARDYGFLIVKGIANLEQELHEEATGDYGSPNGENIASEEGSEPKKKPTESTINKGGDAMEIPISSLITAATAHTKQLMKERWEVIADELEAVL